MPVRTFLFTDLESSTRLWERFPVAMQSALERHDSLLRAAVEGANGRVVKSTGDGLYAVFDSARDAIMACLQAQQALSAEPWGEIGTMPVRMGLHTGEAQSRGADYFGPTVNRTARLMSAAHGGQVLLSAAAASLVRDVLPDGATLQDLGEHRLKDLEQAERIFQLNHKLLVADFPPLATLNLRPNNLPVQPTTFVGREKELAETKELLLADSVRMLTLVGPGGTGKTRLALQLAADLIDRYQDGVYLVELASVRQTDAFLSAIATTVGLTETTEGALIDHLKSQLRASKMLLVLDNFEQVTVAAPAAAELLQSCPHLELLVTSREALRVRGEHLYPVPPLALPAADILPPSTEELARSPAVQLFVERAQAVRPGFELTAENGRAVVEICRRLDGLPLAIELAAARIRLFGPQALLDRLDNRLQLLRGGARDLPLRQQTLGDTIAWSYELLAPADCRLFELLSVFSGGTIEAIETVVASVDPGGQFEIDVFDGLASLVDKSLLRQSDDGFGEPRFWMLQTIREYAGERLAANPEFLSAAQRAHAATYADFASRQWERLTGDSRETAQADLTADLENVRAAWAYWVRQSELEQLNKIVDSLWLLFDTRGRYSSLAGLTTDLLAVLASAPSTPERAEQQIMLQTSLARTLLAIKGYTPEVEEAYTRALELAGELGDVPQPYPVLRGLASYYNLRADFENGAQVGEKILRLAEQKNDDRIRLVGHLITGVNVALYQDLSAGLAHLEQAYSYYDPRQRRPGRFRLGYNPGVVALTTSGFTHWLKGMPDSARERADQALALAKSLNHPYSQVYALFHTGMLYVWLREMEQVKAHAQAMLEIVEEHEFQIWKALALFTKGVALSGLGQPQEGLSLVEQGMDLYEGLVTPPVFWPQLLTMRAAITSQAGNPEKGLSLLARAEEIAGVQNENAILTPMFAIMRSDLLLAHSASNAAQAESLLWQAARISREKGAMMVALQAATRLCRLARGDRQAAQEPCRLLREIYETFTEGFSTADLIEAKELLDRAG